MKSITIRQPDDWHLHLRDEAVLEAVLPWSANVYGRAIIMPNLKPPITTVAAAKAYRNRILAALPAGSSFQPLMTCYLTDNLEPDEIRRGKEEGVFTAAKLYPAGATTNSDHGITNIQNIYPVLETMQEVGMPLLIHGEVTDPEIDIFDREAVFIERVLIPVLNDFPELKVVSEHITTETAVNFIASQSDRVGATITTHHLMINRNAIFQGGIRPHMYCLPIAKREKHRLALRKAATSGDPHFFLGTDSAPHLIHLKEHECGCAGVFNSPNTMECLAHVFDEENALDKLESFTSLNGPRFYGLPTNTNTITLEKAPPSIPSDIPVAGLSDSIKVFTPPVELAWRLQ
ncbi:MAG: dihydroorotase [Chloroflexota bacterium]